jgi:hypothetical protein
MVYECEYCGYFTNRKYDLERHKNRINKCYKIIVDVNNVKQMTNQNAIKDDPNVSINDPNVAKDDSNVAKNDSNVTKDNKCELCFKIFSNKSNLTKHLKICKGVDSLTCEKCKVKFISRSQKYKHLKNNKCKSLNEIKNITNIETQNNNTNNIETQNNIENQNFNINVFGEENLNYLLNDDHFIQRIKQFGKKGIYGLANVISDVHCSHKQLENNTIIKPDMFGSAVYVMSEEKEWEYREFEDIKEELINTISKYIKYYNDKRKNHNVEYKDRREKNFLRNLFYFALALECHVPKDLFEDLEMDDDNVEENENELDNINKKFDKATMIKIHENTHLRYRKEKGNFVKK